MKNIILPLLVTSLFASAEVTTSIGEYKYGPDTSEETACKIAESIAKENAILNITGEEIGHVTLENCKQQACDIQKDFISDSSGYIKSVIDKTVQTGKAIGYSKCSVVLRADVEKIDNPIKFKLDSNHFNFTEGDEVIISGSTNKQGLVAAFLFVDGVYHLLDGELIASSPNNFMLPSTRETKLIAYLPQNKLQSKELLTVLFIEADGKRYDIQQKYNKVQMENFLISIPVQKRKVINNYVYIMKKENSI